MTIHSTDEPLTLIQTGKVRELYDAGQGRLLMVASDRISAFDVIMAEPIPDKGRVLTAMTAYWLEALADLAPNHLISADVSTFPAGAAALAGGLDGLAGRAMLVHRADMLDIECIVRGYLAGSAYKEYERQGTVHGMAMPSGLRHADRLPEPIFTPSTKATEGHDLNIGMAEAIDLVGKEAAEAAAELCLAAYAGQRPGPRSKALSSATPSSSSVTSTAPCPCATRCSPPTRVASGRPTTVRQAPIRRRSTSSRCVTGWRPSPGTSSRHLRHCPTRSWTPPPPAMSPPTNGSVAVGCPTGTAVERTLRKRSGSGCDWYGASWSLN